MECSQKEILHKHDLPAGFEDFPQPPKTFTWRTNSCFLALAHSIQTELTEQYSDPNTAAFVASPLINHAAWLLRLSVLEAMHLALSPLILRHPLRHYQFLLWNSLILFYLSIGGGH